VGGQARAEKLQNCGCTTDLRREEADFLETCTMEEDIELAKHKLEEKRFEAELRLKEAELDLKRLEIETKIESERRSRTFVFSPQATALLAGLFAIFGTIIGSYIQGRSNAESERQKFESSLIIKAIETGDPKKAAHNLSFLLRAGFLHDSNGQIASVIATPENAPVLPSTGKSIKPCGVWQSANSSKRYTFVCHDENTFEIFENDPNQGLIRVGSGVISQGSVNGSLFVRDKGRAAALSLRISEDGQKMEGSFKGLDPTEFGQVVFQKLE
jgi:hypothetical protein